MPDNDIYFSSENLDMYLKELAKEFRKLNGKKMPAEIILVGGAAILANYGFREKTYDVDAIVRASSAMKDAARYVGDKFGLPEGWLNSDFIGTDSYSPKLSIYSTHYRTFSNIVEFRTVSGEYLVAMKLMAGRPYKHDLSDVAEIIAEHQKNGNPLSRDLILTAINNLYGNADKIHEDSMKFLDMVLSAENIQDIIAERKESEKSAKTALLEFEEDYENILNEDNLFDILESIQAKKENRDIQIQENQTKPSKKQQGVDYDN